MPLYNPTGAPANRSPGSSATIRAEFVLIAAALDLFPDLTGNGGKLVRVNVGETGFEAATSIDGTPIGSTNPSTGAFSTLTVNTSLGVGTLSPAARIHAVGSGPEVARLETTVARGSGSNYLSFNDPTGRKGRVGYIGAADDTITLVNDLNAALALSTNATERMRVSASGQVGINTAVFGGSNVNGATFEPYVGGIVAQVGHNGSAASGDEYLRLQRSGVTVGSLYQFSSNGIGIASAADIHFSAGGAERAILSATGQFGLNVTTPSQMMDLASATAQIVATSTTPTNQGHLKFINGAGSGVFFGVDNSAGGVFGSTYAGAVWQNGPYAVVFGTNGTLRMTITSAGGVVMENDLLVKGGFSTGNASGGGISGFGSYPTAIPSSGAVRIGRLSTGQPSIYFGLTGGGADAKIWEMFADTNTLSIRAVNDAYGAATTALTFGRSGATVTSANFGSIVNAPSFNGYLTSGNVSQFTNDAGYVGSATVTPTVVVHRGGVDAYTSATYTRVTWDVEDLDVSNNMSTTGFTAPTNGLYLVAYNITHEATGGAATMGVQIRKNNVSYVPLVGAGTSSGSGDLVTISGESIMSLNAADVVEMFCNRINGAGQANADNNSMTIRQLR